MSENDPAALSEIVERVRRAPNSYYEQVLLCALDLRDAEINYFRTEYQDEAGMSMLRQQQSFLQAEIAWLRRLLSWSIPRMRLSAYSSRLEEYLAAGVTDTVPNEPPIIHADNQH